MAKKPKEPETNEQDGATKKKAKRSSAVVLHRVQRAFGVILDSGQFEDFKDIAKGEQWTVCDRVLRRYWADAQALLTERLEQDRSRVLAAHLLRRERLYANAVRDKDWRAALAVMKDLARIQSVYPEKKLDTRPVDTAKGRVEVLLANPEFARMLRDVDQWEPPLLELRKPDEEKQA